MSPPRREQPPRETRYWSVPRARRMWVGIVGWTLWAAIGLVVSILGGAYIYLDDTLEVAVPNTAEAKAARAATRPVLPGQPTNILLIGSDTRPSDGDPGRSDSLILVRMDPQRDLISMLSFPRDLWVDIPGHGQGKINSAYSFGPATTINTVKQLTGQPVNDYVVVDFSGFAKLVDRVGGVYIDVDRRYYNKNIGTAATNFSDIDILPGYQRLDGSDALAYVRYRHTDSTYARDARQQLFLSELKRQAAQLGNFSNVTSLRKIFADKTLQMSIEDPGRFIKLMNLALFVPKDRIARASIEGSSGMIDGASVELADQSEIDAKVALWKEPEFVQETNTAKPIDPSEVTVTVLNGSGTLLAAEDVAQALADKRYRTRVGRQRRRLRLRLERRLLRRRLPRPRTQDRGPAGAGGHHRRPRERRWPGQPGGRGGRRRLHRHARDAAEGRGPARGRHRRHDQPRGSAARPALGGAGHAPDGAAQGRHRLRRAHRARLPHLEGRRRQRSAGPQDRVPHLCRRRPEVLEHLDDVDEGPADRRQRHPLHERGP